jgi:DNA-binding NtrC family response regulator
MSRLCLVEDDPIMGESLTQRFALEGIDALWLRSAEEAEQALRGGSFGAVVCDIRLPGLSGDQLFERLRTSRPVLPPFVFITGFGDLSRAVELLKLGAADYITKPFDLDRLIARVMQLLGPGAARPGDAGRLGVSGAMDRIEKLLARIAPRDTMVLIRGETGTGKEVVARRLHQLSGRGPFVAVNCAALVETLAESELFGHERGAFTGATQAHAGVFEQAHGGTLFLDEIGDMPLPLQAKLLRVLQDRAVVRVGGQRPIPVDTRLVLATHQDLEALIGEGRFREDLFFRINLLELRIPPLRERRDDILWLARCFLDDCGRRRGDRMRQLEADAEQALSTHDWPGNVRELRHTIERACIFSDAETLRAGDLFEPGLSEPGDGDPAEDSLDHYLASCERRYIETRLEAHAGRVAATAETLGISRKSLWQRMKRLGIRRKASSQLG